MAWLLASCVGLGASNCSPSSESENDNTAEPGPTESSTAAAPATTVSSDATLSGGDNPAPTVTSSVPTQPGAPGAAFEAQVPEVVLGELEFPARIAIDGEFLYVADRRRFRLDGSLDRMLRAPLSDPSKASVLFEAAEIDTFAIMGDTMWVTGTMSSAAASFGLTDGVERARVALEEPMKYVQVTRSGSDWLFVSANADTYGPGEYSMLQRAPGDGVEASAIWRNADYTEYPTQLRTTAAGLFFVTNGKDVEGMFSSRLVRLDADGSEPAELLKRRFLGSFAFAKDEIIFTDDEADTVEAMPIGGGAPRVLGSIDMPWAVLTDGDFVYVTNQPDPDTCAGGPVGSLSRIALADGTLTTLADPLPCPSMMLVTDKYLYWVNNGGAQQTDAPLVIPEGTEPSESYTLSLGNGAVMRIAR